MKPVLFLLAIFFTGSFAYSQNVIHSEDFSSGIPSNYSQSTNATDGGWNTGLPNSLQSQYFQIEDQGSGKIIATNDDDCDCDKSNDLLQTKSIDLSSYSGSTVFLRFDNFYYDRSVQSGDQENATVDVSTDGGNTWNTEKDVSTGIWSRESVDLSSYTGQTIQIGFRYNDGGGWLYGWAIDNILVEEPVNYDLNVDSLIAPSNHKLSDGPITLKATVFNNGGETISSFDINYVVNGDTTTDNINNVNIKPLDDLTFTISSPLAPSSKARLDVEAFTSNINGGNADQVPSNDKETANIIVYDTSYQRKPLYEVFTSSTCSPCAPGNENFEDIMSNYPGEAVTVKFQQNFPQPGDPYSTDESVTRRRNFYGVNAVPNMQIDGGWDGNANDFTATLHQEAANKPAFVTIDAEYKVWPDSQQQKVEVCYEIKSNFNYSNKTLYASINEDTTTKNVGSNNETEFYNVFKKWFPSSDTTIDLNQNTTMERCMSYSFNGDYRLPDNANNMIDHAIEHSVEEFTDLNVAIWVQDDQTQNLLQASYANKIDTQETYSVGPRAPEDTTSIVYQDNDNSLEVNLFPNPAANNVNLSVSSVSHDDNISLSIYNLKGQKVYDLGQKSLTSNKNLSLNVQDYKNGIYILAISTEDAVQYEKLIIQK